MSPRKRTKAYKNAERAAKNARAGKRANRLPDYSDVGKLGGRSKYVARYGPVKGDVRYNELLQKFILERGVQRGPRGTRKMARFEELYRKARADNWNPCPPANDTTENGAPYAYLLDYIGARPLSEFGWLCIGDTPKG